jgi:hypothetical protein
MGTFFSFAAACTWCGVLTPVKGLMSVGWHIREGSSKDSSRRYVRKKFRNEVI